MERLRTEESCTNIKVTTGIPNLQNIPSHHLGNYLVATKRKIFHTSLPERADPNATSINTKRQSESIAYTMVHR